MRRRDAPAARTARVPDIMIAWRSSLGTVSSYEIAGAGSLDLRDAVADSTRLGEKGIRDEGITRQGRYFYALDADARKVLGGLHEVNGPSVLRRVEVAPHHTRPLGAEQLGCGTTLTPARAGDQHDLPVESASHLSLLSSDPQRPRIIGEAADPAPRGGALTRHRCDVARRVTLRERARSSATSSGACAARRASPPRPCRAGIFLSPFASHPRHASARPARRPTRAPCATGWAILPWRR